MKAERRGECSKEGEETIEDRGASQGLVSPLRALSLALSTHFHSFSLTYTTQYYMASGIRLFHSH